MNQIIQSDKKSNDISSLYPKLNAKQVKAARMLASNVSVGTIASSLNVAESIVSGWLDDDEFINAVAFISGRGNIVSQLIQEATVLSWMHVVDTLAHDWSSAPASTKAEILKTARMVVQMSNESPQNINNNVGTVQMYVSGGSVDAIARRVTELQTEAETARTDNAATEYNIIDVDALYSAHPDTDIGTINYDEESDRYQCHVCGKWYPDLFMHTNETHGLKKDKYCEMYGIS